MSTSRYFDRVAAAALALCLALTLLMYSAEGLGVQVFSRELGYESRLFSTDWVHTIDIVIDDWERFLATAQSEEYTLCDVVIDGEAVQNVAIRGKGNTSLSQVSAMDSDRYSFKIEFDQYDNAKTFHGLDKLCLNNLIQDNTMMKDYLVYQLMGQFGAAAPLCSFAYLTVNGEDWGLYLAVEAIEESFLQRNYGSDYGDLYKPDSMSMGGGRGNGRDFDMNNWQEQFEKPDDTAQTMAPPQGGFGGRGPGGNRGQIPGQAESSNPAAPELPEGFDPSAMFGQQPPESFDPSQMGGGKGGMNGGMGSADVKLQYVDDDPSSYVNIFDSAKTPVTDADQTRLIAALKALSEFDSRAVDVEAVLKYFVVHNFVVNGDSYTGSMIHNYYLYEENGRLSMLPWDYNLAFGSFQGGNAAASVNDDIDAPLSCTGSGDRPMMDWILKDAAALEQYHRYFSDFIQQFDFEAIIAQTADLIAPYVQKDPTKFCTYEDFLSGAAALKQFCTLRAESVSRQLSGDDTLVDTGDLDLSSTGTMNKGGGFGNRENRAEGAAPQMPVQGEPDRQPAFGRDNLQMPGQTIPQSGGDGLLLTVLSALLLTLGLLVAWKYKR